jgi:hypothetical protein
MCQLISRKSRCQFALLVGAAFFQPAAMAEQQAWRFEITPIGGYRFGGTFDIEGSDASYDIGDSTSYGLLLNLRDRADTQWELLYAAQSSDAELKSGVGLQRFVDINLHTLQFGGTYQGTGTTLRPYVAATIGGTRVSTAADSDHFFSGSIGVGLQIRPDARIGIRIEVRAYGTLTDSDTDLFCRTGPDQNVCAVAIDANVLGQIETFAGLVFRF